MSKVCEHVDEKLAAWIVQQRLFFVATAPRSDAGHVNVSPKGPIETLRILGPRRVAYLDLIGSGAETVAHVRENGRIVLMLCAFDGPPRIVRLHGHGHVVQTGEQDFDKLNGELGFTDVAVHDGGRAIVTIDIERVSDSCGMGVPLMHYRGERPQYPAWIRSEQNKGDNALLDRVTEWNVTSIDGLPAVDPTILPRRRSQPERLVLNGRVSHASRRLTGEPVGRAPDYAAGSARLVPEQILGPWGLTFRAPDGTSCGQ